MMASHIETKAMQLRDQAAKKLIPGGFLKTLFGGGENKEEAIVYYTRAANLFKMAKNWLQAGLAFSDAADLSCKTEDSLEAAINYTEAGNCFKKCDYLKAVQYFLKAIKHYSEMGRFVTAAKLHQTLADLMEEERDLSGAVHHYELAADLFREENLQSLSHKCVLKVAEASALEGKYQKAVKLFQDIACFELSSSLLHYNAKEYFFRAAICYLAHDPDIVESIVNRYIEMHPAFKDSRECHLIFCLLESLELKDLDGYANAIRTYDSISKLPMWHVTMLLRAKNTIDKEESLR